jgi:hypothetical protein
MRLRIRRSLQLLNDASHEFNIYHASQYILAYVCYQTYNNFSMQSRISITWKTIAT